MKQRKLKSVIQFIIFILISNLKSTSTRDQSCDPDIPSRLPPVHHLNLLHNPDERARNCSEGQYLEWYWCSPCPDGSFRTRLMSREDKYSRCHKCHINGMYEIIAEPCTATRDSKIMCEDGFYRYQVPGKTCQSYCILCDVCGVGKNMFKNFVGRECVEHNNTVCCESPDMVVVDEVCVLFLSPTISSHSTTGSTSSPTSSTDNFQNSIQNYSKYYANDNSVSMLDRNLRVFMILTTLNEIVRVIMEIKCQLVAKKMCCNQST
ncbi:hypothetical protein Btru_026850 [Bulinus truncatus]|nr:hypothetical protein Btru_026850 [Bulinus truncatus]